MLRVVAVPLCACVLLLAVSRADAGVSRDERRAQVFAPYVRERRRFAMDERSLLRRRVNEEHKVNAHTHSALSEQQLRAMMLSNSSGGAHGGGAGKKAPPLANGHTFIPTVKDERHATQPAARLASEPPTQHAADAAGAAAAQSVPHTPEQRRVATSQSMVDAMVSQQLRPSHVVSPDRAQRSAASHYAALAMLAVLLGAALRATLNSPAARRVRRKWGASAKARARLSA